MKTVSKFLMTLIVIIALSVTGCRDTKKESTQDDHGHSHEDGSDHSHEHEEVKQEEFTIGEDSIKTEDKDLKHYKDEHSHDNEGQGHDHDH